MPPFTQSVFSMHWYPMRERWASLTSSAEFHDGSRTWPDGSESCSELPCRSCRQAPMTGPTTVNLGVAVFLRGLSYPSPETALQGVKLFVPETARNCPGISASATSQPFETTACGIRSRRPHHHLLRRRDRTIRSPYKHGPFDRTAHYWFRGGAPQ
jgi:hypothetical protein